MGVFDRLKRTAVEENENPFDNGSEEGDTGPASDEAIAPDSGSGVEPSPPVQEAPPEPESDKSIYLCPFCGSESITGGGADSTVTCHSCNTRFQVVVKPKFSRAPQVDENGNPVETDTQEGFDYPEPGVATPEGEAAPEISDGASPAPEAPQEAPVEGPGQPEQGGLDEAFQSAEPTGDPATDLAPDEGEAVSELDAAFEQAVGEVAPEEPQEEEEESDDENPFPPKQSYRTATGGLVSEEDFIRHLALSRAERDGRTYDQVLRRVRASRRR